jgi:ferredoxin
VTRPAAICIDEAACIHCELCFEIAPVFRSGARRVAVTDETLDAMAACPVSAIRWCEADDGTAASERT